MTGGEIVARVLERHGVRFLFTLCGGHISPILVEAKRLGIRVVDTRHEVTTVFAADAVARLTGVPGVAAVTAGPGVTNTVTAIKNAQLAQSPLVLLGGASATVLRGRGSLQDIDQLALFRPHVKATLAARRLAHVEPLLDRAFAVARQGVPGPVFVELPVDLLYPEELVRGWYAAKTEKKARTLGQAAVGWYLRRHLDKLFAGAPQSPTGDGSPRLPEPSPPRPGQVRKAAALLARSERPLLVVGSQAMLDPAAVDDLVAAVERLGLPTYLGGMARGLLGAGHPLHMRHKRRAALKEADLVVLAGFPCDFRMDYGSHIRRSTPLVSANRSRHDLILNRKPTLGLEADPALFLRRLAAASASGKERWSAWIGALAERDAARDREIAEQAAQPASEHLNPVALCREIEAALPDDSVLVADGGDFVGTASYVVRPRGPLRWLDPGVFGTLGVGAGFALGAKLCYPEAEVWILYGDGSAGYSLSEIDTFVRHRLPVIAVVGNDACWMQIAREQVEILGDDVGTVLAHTDYHRVAEGFGGAGFAVDKAAETAAVLARAQAAAAAGRPVVVNALIGKTDFRKGSISI